VTTLQHRSNDHHHAFIGTTERAPPIVEHLLGTLNEQNTLIDRQAAELDRQTTEPNLCREAA
jgi:hypothetical protein